MLEGVGWIETGDQVLDMVAAGTQTYMDMKILGKKAVGTILILPFARKSLHLASNARVFCGQDGGFPTSSSLYFQGTAVRLAVELAAVVEEAIHRQRVHLPKNFQRVTRVFFDVLNSRPSRLLTARS